MNDARRRELEARELRLLQERSEIQHQIDRMLDATGGWDREQSKTLERRRQRIQDELVIVRRELTAVFKGG